jgi:hypothetical protein
MSWPEFLGVVALIGIGWAWHASLAAREFANRIAADTCTQAGVQLLDGTVAMLKLALARSDDGRLVLRRTYVFDYSEDGYGRRRGFVVLTGLSLDSVGLGPRAVS